MSHSIVSGVLALPPAIRIHPLAASGLDRKRVRFTSGLATRVEATVVGWMVGTCTQCSARPAFEASDSMRDRFALQGKQMAAVRSIRHDRKEHKTRMCVDLLFAYAHAPSPAAALIDFD